MQYKSVFLLFLLSETVAFGMKPDSPDPRLCDGGFDFSDVRSEHARKKSESLCPMNQCISLCAVEGVSGYACFCAQALVFQTEEINAGREHSEDARLVFTLSLSQESSGDTTVVQEDGLRANVCAAQGERANNHVSGDEESTVRLCQHMQAPGERAKVRSRKRACPTVLILSVEPEGTSLQKTIECSYAGCTYKTDKMRNLKAHCARMHVRPVFAKDNH